MPSISTPNSIRLVLSNFGKTPLPAIRVQVEQLRRRLAAFAHWQSQWAAQGWRIEHAEVLIGKTAANVAGTLRVPECPIGTRSVPDTLAEAQLEVDSEPMPLRGKIDRIDINDSLGRCMIFDYKTSDEAKKPKAARVGRLLGVPEGKDVRIVLPLGVPAEPAVQREKLPFAQRAWFNQYGG